MPRGTDGAFRRRTCKSHRSEAEHDPERDIPSALMRGDRSGHVRCHSNAVCREPAQVGKLPVVVREGHARGSGETRSERTTACKWKAQMEYTVPDLRGSSPRMGSISVYGTEKAPCRNGLRNQFSRDALRQGVCMKDTLSPFRTDVQTTVNRAPDGANARRGTDSIRWRAPRRRTRMRNVSEPQNPDGTFTAMFSFPEGYGCAYGQTSVLHPHGICAMRSISVTSTGAEMRWKLCKSATDAQTRTPVIYNRMYRRPRESGMREEHITHLNWAI
jgi:hypothetical protein